MTSNEMYLYWCNLYDAASMVEMAYDTEEISRFLTMGQNDIYEEQYTEYLTPIRRGYEVTSKRDNVFRNLKEYVEITEFVSYDKIPNAYLVQLPDNYRYNSLEQFEMIYNSSSLKNIEVLPMNEDNIVENYDNPFNKPWRNKIWRVTERDSNVKRHCLILPNGATPTKYKLSYLRVPKDIVINLFEPDKQVNSEMSEDIHKEIVRKAVYIAQLGAGSQKFQATKAETKEHF